MITTFLCGFNCILSLHLLSVVDEFPINLKSIDIPQTLRLLYLIYACVPQVTLIHYYDCMKDHQA